MTTPPPSLHKIFARTELRERRQQRARERSTPPRRYRDTNEAQNTGRGVSARTWQTDVWTSTEMRIYATPPWLPCHDGTCDFDAVGVVPARAVTDH
jgi:hypothetical protein